MQVISHLYCFQILKEGNPAYVAGGNLPAEENGALYIMLGTAVLLRNWILETWPFCWGQYFGYRIQWSWCLCAQREGKLRSMIRFCFAVEIHLSSCTGLGPLMWVGFVLVFFKIKFILKLNEMKSNYIFNVYSRGKESLKN